VQCRFIGDMGKDAVLHHGEELSESSTEGYDRDVNL
jgi:hypothetical protein